MLDDNDPYKLALRKEEMYHGCEHAAIHYEGEDAWYKVYTDVSGFNGTQREIARAGWGAYFGKGSSANIADKLYGSVQTSYRAELRALLHVVRTTEVPVLKGSSEYHATIPGHGSQG